MRTIFAVITITFALTAAAQTGAVDPESLLQRGIEHFRAARHAEAAADLGSAAQAFLSPDNMQAYVNTGRFESLPRFETALVYLALAQARLGNETEAREAVLRLATAERIAPTYTSLPLGTDGAEFEILAARLVPDLALRRDVQIAAAPVAPPTQSDRVVVVEQMVAQDCARIEREAEARIAVIRQEAEERIAAVERAAEARVAEAQRVAEARIAEAQRLTEATIAEAQRAADQRVAAAEAAALRAREEQRVAVTREPAPSPVPVPAPPAQTRVTIAEPQSRAEWVMLLRRADDAAAAGRTGEAREIYARIASVGDVAREIRIAAAVGLYRISAYGEAVEAFQRLAPFIRGEEDLRYYNAVSLYERGRYADARHELSCALPFIQRTEDVIRYRTKIEQMVALSHR